MNRLPIAFGRLPKVLLNEIYEFARGDRKYWKSQMSIAIRNTHTYDGMAFVAISKPHNGKTVRLINTSDHSGFYVTLFIRDGEDFNTFSQWDDHYNTAGLIDARRWHHDELLAGKLQF